MNMIKNICIKINHPNAAGTSCPILAVQAQRIRLLAP